MLRQGSGEPLVLFHGITGSECHWRHVVPLLAAHHDVIVPNALGHLGGRPPSGRPVAYEHLFADAERTLDELGIEGAHLAGNSMGGWMALELARRGRALSACALSPAGMWLAGGREQTGGAKGLRDMVRDGRRARPLLPLLFRLPQIRRQALRLNAVHGAAVTHQDLLDIVDATLGCKVFEDLIETPEHFAPLDPPPCPITVAWSEHDRVLPLETCGKIAQERIPGARFTVLEGVGHVPMLDDPELVATTILARSRPE